jgi:hypothetical protein
MSSTLSNRSSAVPSRASSPSNGPMPFDTFAIEDIIQVFYSHLASIVPYVEKEELLERIRQGTAGEALVFIVAALVERYDSLVFVYCKRFPI